MDSDARLLESLRGLRRRLPGDEQFGDPLSTGGRTAVGYLARSVAVLAPERDSVLGEVGLASLQLWQSLSERTGRGRGEVDVALLHTDLVDFSSWALKAGDIAAVALLAAVGEVIDGAVRRQSGRITKRLGDGVIATFLLPAHAIAAALEIQEGVASVEIEGHTPQIRAGVHWGRPRRLGGEYLGVDLTIANAVGAAAKPGQVLVSAPALAQLEPSQVQLKVGRRRRLRAEGVPRELQVASVRRDQ